MDNIDELKSTGLKATLPRLKILEIFQKGEQRHMTAEDVYRCCWPSARTSAWPRCTGC
jgi:Fur family ferric uptake transcriptional regulator